MNDSWDSARKHPRLTLVGLFTGGFIGLGLISYVGAGGRDVYPSVATGLGCGVILALLGWKTMREGVDAVPRPLRPLSVFNVLIAGAGVVLIGWGLATTNWSLALAGLPLLALGAGLILARRLVGRRGTSR